MKVKLCKALVVVFLVLVWTVGPAAARQTSGSMSQKTFDKIHAADMQAEKAGKVFKMSGRITAVDLQHNTVVIACPENSRIFTVGGPLSKTAELTAKGKTARLSDFKKDDAVSVRWEATGKGHLILMLATG
jgi:predicted PilT family ATPase